MQIIFDGHLLHLRTKVKDTTEFKYQYKIHSTFEPPMVVENAVASTLWLISTFVDIVWTEFHSAQDALLDVRKVFGYLTFKYRLGQKVIGAIPFLE